MAIETLISEHIRLPAQATASPPVLHRSLYGWSRVAKRLIDIVVASISLIVMAPVLLLVAIAIRLDSRGPILFKQSRVGLYGREFELYKFRSMVVDAEARQADLLALNQIKDGPIFKLKHDPRITRVGRWIRRTSLDEFPQLVNVLRGEMSLVGPRPPLPSEVAQYAVTDRERLSVIPGVTGLWQVSGRSELDSFRTMVRLDLAYITGWSLWRDVEILARTIKVVARMEGSW